MPEPSRFLASLPAGTIKNMNEFASVSKPHDPVKRTSPLKVGSNLDNIKSFFNSQNIDFKLPEGESKRKSSSGLKKGSQVQHPKFGFGVVHQVEGQGKGKKARIYFKEAGYKNILLE